MGCYCTVILPVRPAIVLQMCTTVGPHHEYCHYKKATVWWFPWQPCYNPQMVLSSLWWCLARVLQFCWDVSKATVKTGNHHHSLYLTIRYYLWFTVTKNNVKTNLGAQVVIFLILDITTLTKPDYLVFVCVKNWKHKTEFVIPVRHRSDTLRNRILRFDIIYWDRLQSFTTQ